VLQASLDLIDLTKATAKAKAATNKEKEVNKEGSKKDKDVNNSI
jgi:hypothetical protein